MLKKVKIFLKHDLIIRVGVYQFHSQNLHVCNVKFKFKSIYFLKLEILKCLCVLGQWEKVMLLNSSVYLDLLSYKIIFVMSVSIGFLKFKSKRT